MVLWERTCISEKETKSQIEIPKPTTPILYAAATKLLATPDLTRMEMFISFLLPSPKEDHGIHARIRNRDFYHFCSENFPNSTSLKLLRVYASSEPRFEERVREGSIRRLSDLLLDHGNRGKSLLAFLGIQELAPLLVSCLEEQGIDEGRFKILAQVTNHVAFEIFNTHNDVWFDLREFLSSRAESEFKKVVYIFKSLSIPLDEVEFVIPLVRNLLSPILKRLHPSQVCRESNWALAFAGAFSLAIHLLETIRGDLVGNIVYQMLKSAAELVDRGIMGEVLVREALRDVEMLVLKQSVWYCITEYKFVSGLVRRMKKIKGLGKETQMVLWRIQVVLDKHTSKSFQEPDNGDEDWLNQCL